MNSDPSITIIIATYNRAALLPLAVKSALEQTFSDFELLILDDASTDSTHEVIQPFLEDARVRLITHPSNIGITANRNYGLSIAKGIYIAMLDSDDVWLDDCKLKRQIDILETHPQCGLIGSNALKINEKGEEIGLISLKAADLSIRKNMMFMNQIIQSSVLIRKEALDAAGWYDESLPIWEDYELWLRIGERYQFRNIPEPLIGYRIHSTNISNDSKEKTIKAYEIIYRLYKKKYPWSIALKAKIIIKKIQLRFRGAF